MLRQPIHTIRGTWEVDLPVKNPKHPEVGPIVSLRVTKQTFPDGPYPIACSTCGLSKIFLKFICGTQKPPNEKYGEFIIGTVCRDCSPPRPMVLTYRMWRGKQCLMMRLRASDEQGSWRDASLQSAKQSIEMLELRYVGANTIYPQPYSRRPAAGESRQYHRGSKASKARQG